MAITEDESKLIAIFVQSCLWGMFAVVFILTYWTLIYKRPSDRPLSQRMVGVLVLMFVIATIQLGTNFSRIIRAFIIFKDAPGEFWDLLSEFSQLFGSAMYVAQTFIGDAVALYRTYIVWGRRLPVVLVPGAAYIGSVVAGIGILVTMGQTTDSPIFAHRLQHWIASFFSCTLATSLICTLMISSRVWYLDRRTNSRKARRSLLHPVARVTLESGAIYSAVLIALLGTFLTDTWFQFVLVDSLSPLIGITFSIIILRVGLGITTDPETMEASQAAFLPREQAPLELRTFEAFGRIEQPKGEIDS